MKHEQMEKATYTCPMHADLISDKPGECPKCGMTLVEKKMDKMMMKHDSSKMNMKHSKMDHSKMAKTYVCSMHPKVTSDKPGECPKCGMALVEKKMDKMKMGKMMKMKKEESKHKEYKH